MPRSLPALMRAAELGRKLDWSPGNLEYIKVALDAPPTEETLGELLLAVTDYARAAGVDPEFALRRAADARAETTEPTR